jgi:hypothetical protein
MPKTVDEFWMVWNPSGRAPTYRHPSLNSAQNEAKRLAVTCPGYDFIVLKAIGGYRMPTPGPEPIIIDDGIPF